MRAGAGGAVDRAQRPAHRRIEQWQFPATRPRRVRRADLAADAERPRLLHLRSNYMPFFLLVRGMGFIQLEEGYKCC